MTRTAYISALLVWLAILSSCSNYITTETTQSMDITRTPIKSEPSLEVSGINSESIIKIKAEKLIEEKVVTDEVTKREDVSTPYRGYRKLYQMPLGLLLFPAAIVVSVADVCTLGLIPNRFTDDLLDYSFTGMNPFLCWEDNSTTVRTLESSTKRQIDAKEEITVLPLRNVDLYIVSNTSETFDLKIDDNNHLNVTLVKIAVEGIKNPIDLRYFDLYLESTNNKPVTKIVISRKMAFKFLEAKKMVDSLQINSSPANLVECVLGLENLGFSEYALNVENEYKEKNISVPGYNEQFDSEMKKQMKFFPLN